MIDKRFRRGLMGAAIAAALLAAYGVGSARLATEMPATGMASTAPVVQTAPSTERALPPGGIAEVVARAGPAVVHVSVTRQAQPVAAGPQAVPFDRDNPLFEYFRRFAPMQPPGPVQGQGSGFIVDADGLILTNAHVVDGATGIRVRMTDRREFAATLVGLDRATDVAVLRIDARDLPTVSIGDPARLRVGDWVVAIGAPFGFDNSVTAGIVSAKARALPDETYIPFIQTDVAVNPGNSGGPLLNLAGEVVGINSQIYSRSGGYQGISFAIPIDVASGVQQQLVADGRVDRGRLGVSIQELDQSLASAFGLQRPAGALVSQVESDGPADRAGLRAGDVIVSLDGRPVNRAAELPPLVAGQRPGDEVALGVWRDREQQTVRVRIGALAGDEGAARASQAQSQGASLGLALRPLQPRERADAKLAGGLVVESVSGPAAQAGIRPGDVVLALNGKPVETVESLRKELAGAGSNVALYIDRDGTRLFVPVELG